LLHQCGGLCEVVSGGQGVVRGVDVAADVDTDDVGALLREADRMTAALAAPCSGDERNSVV
jgi:hypothetical protein